MTPAENYEKRIKDLEGALDLLLNNDPSDRLKHHCWSKARAIRNRHWWRTEKCEDSNS